MVNYVFIDNENKVKSVAEWEGVQIQFWWLLFDDYTEEEVEAYIKAEVKLAKGEIDEVMDIIEPFMSGENTITIMQTEEEGIPVTIINGEDTRSLLKRWHDEKGL